MDIIQTLEVVKFFGIIVRQSQAYITKAVAIIDISFSEFVFLSNLYSNEGINQEELSNVLFLDRAATARSVKTLEEKGFITRKRDENDKRVKRLYLTKKGRKSKMCILTALKEWMEYLSLGMDEVSKTTIFQNLKSMAEQAENDEVNMYKEWE